VACTARRAAGRRDLGDVADLGGQVACHRVHVVGQVLPGAGNAGHVGLAGQPAFGADLARDARHLAGEAVELVDHRVQRFLELQDFAAHVDRDLAREVAAGDGGGDLGDVAHLDGQVADHGVDRIGKVLPGAGDARHYCLAAELALGADLAGDPGHLRSRWCGLVGDAGVEGRPQPLDIGAGVDGDLLGEVAIGDGDGDLGDVAHLSGEVARHRVDALGKVLPDAGYLLYLRLAAELALGADLAGNPG